MRIFLAGATGVIGQRLVPMLVRAGHGVVGTTRSPQKVAELERQGATAAVVDVFEAAALNATVSTARPDVVIHQLTDLPRDFDPSQMVAARVRNARLRIEGTRNLVAAAIKAGARRMIAQSIAFAYAPGPGARLEDDALDLGGEGDRGETARAVAVLETAVLNAAGLEGIVLRYGRLYGPGTWYSVAEGAGALHVDAAAHAAFLALTRGSPGVYNVAEDDSAVVSGKVRSELGFDPAFRLTASPA
jgi:nucleoside-diphosphate-sugar epimerase